MEFKEETSPLKSLAHRLKKNFFQNKMTEIKQKCQYYNSGYCKYKEKCTFSHPIEECEMSCKETTCPKRHRKLCRYGERCRHKSKCSYKHRENQTFNSHSENLASLLIKVKELLDYKKNSEAKIYNLEKELKSVQLKKDKKHIKVGEVSVRGTEQIKKDFIKLKSEFELLKLCQRNQISKTVELKNPERELNKIKCTDCDLKFKTENGLKVHIELVHSPKLSNQDSLRYKYCVISCSDSDVMKKHLEREHKFIGHQCNITFIEENIFKSPTTKHSGCGQTAV